MLQLPGEDAWEDADELPAEEREDLATIGAAHAAFGGRHEDLVDADHSPSLLRAGAVCGGRGLCRRGLTGLGNATAAARYECWTEPDVQI